MIPGCVIDDFSGGNPCSSECIKGVQSKSNDLNNACVGVRVTPATLIGLFFQGKGVVALCPNFNPPPPGGGNGGQTNTDPPKQTTTSIDDPPTTRITTTSIISDSATQTLPPPTTSTTGTTTRWEVSALSITIFGTGSGGTITADPTNPPTQTVSSTDTAATSAENDINNIAGSANSAGTSLDIPFGVSLAGTILMVLGTAAALW